MTAFLRFMARRRFNFIDAITLALTTVASAEGHWLAWLGILLGGVIVSAVAERAAGLGR